MRIIRDQKIGVSRKGARHDHIVICVGWNVRDDRLGWDVHPLCHGVQQRHEILDVFTLDPTSRELFDKLVYDSIAHQQGELSGQPAVISSCVGLVGLRLRYADKMTLVSNTARSRSVTFPISLDGHPAGNSLAAYFFANLAQLHGKLVTRQGAQRGSALPGRSADLSRRGDGSLLLQERNNIQHDGEIVIRKTGDLDHCSAQQRLSDHRDVVHRRCMFLKIPIKCQWKPFRASPRLAAQRLAPAAARNR